MLVAITDLTERARAVETMRQSEERFRALFDSAPNAVIGMDRQGRIVLFNEAATSLFGYEAEEVIGEPLTMLMPQEFRAAHPRHVASFVQEDVSLKPMGTRGVLRGLGKNGEEFPIEIGIAKRPTNGDFEFTAIVRDVTERVQAQQALEDLVRSKDELISSVAHELRTPLSAVVGFAKILQDEVVSGVSGEERAEMIRLIVEDLLTAAKAQAGTLAVVDVPVDLRAQVAQVLETWRQQGVEHIEVTGASIRAMADPARIRQILRNLISNALKYGGDTIRISVSSDDATARIQVSDNGPGIPEEEQQHIFESYHHGPQDPGMTGSIGVGLTISRHLAQLMNGDLTYRHHAEESIFELSLPAAPASHPPAAQGQPRT